VPGQSKGIDLLLKNLLGSSDAGRDWQDDDAMRDGHLATNSQAQGKLTLLKLSFIGRRCSLADSWSDDHVHRFFLPVSYGLL
jgi:hypothetical protein